MSCQDNEYSLVDSLMLFIDSLDYRYRTINKYMNCNDVNKWSTDIVAIINIFPSWNRWLWYSRQVVLIVFGCCTTKYWKLQHVEKSTWEIMLIINLYEIALVTQSGSLQATAVTAVGWRRHGYYWQSTTRQQNCVPVSSDWGPEVSVLLILTRYINLE